MTTQHLPEAGFLSAPARAFREHVHAQYWPWVELLYDINHCATDLQHSIHIHRTKLEEAYGAVLFARTIASVQASVLLLEFGLPSQARTVLRSALETLFPLCAVAKEPTLAAELVASHGADRRTVADRVRKWKNPALRETIAKQASEAELDAMLASKAKSLNQYELAKRADMEDWYLTLYTLLSFAAHGAISDLESHAVLDADGDVVEFKSEPELAEQETVWAWAAEVQLAAMRALSQLFAIGSTDIDALAQRLLALGEGANAG